MKPNLFIIGAMKAGTSSLHKYLSHHPEIFMANLEGSMKEISYFAPHVTDYGIPWGEGNEKPGLSGYLKMFEDASEDQKYLGEASVLYTARPFITGCEERIYKFNPDAKVIYILRHPTKRTISHYWWNVQTGKEDRSILAALMRRREYFDRSDYEMQVRPYFNRFGKDQVYVLTLETLHQKPQETLSDLFDWLGVDAKFSVDTTNKVNEGRPLLKKTRRGFLPINQMMCHWRWRVIEKKLPRFAVNAIKAVVYTPVKRDSGGNAEAEKLIQPMMLEKIKRLSDYLYRDFPEWRDQV
jgi:Sulfotransferase family